MTAAQKRAAALNSERTIYVSGGRGKICDSAAEGSDTKEGRAILTLNPGQGLTVLKALIKKAFGKLKKFRVSCLAVAWYGTHSFWQKCTCGDFPTLSPP